MGLLGLDRETVLDLMVNVIPIGILLFLDALFWLNTPWGWDLWYVFWGHFLTLFPLLLLTVLTYVSGYVVQRDEEKLAGQGEGESHSQIEG